MTTIVHQNIFKLVINIVAALTKQLDRSAVCLSDGRRVCRASGDGRHTGSSHLASPPNRPDQSHTPRKRSRPRYLLIESFVSRLMDPIRGTSEVFESLDMKQLRCDLIVKRWKC